MKKVAVITTGGTIGSIVGGESVSVEGTARRVAREIEAARERLGCSVVLDSPLNKHSENLVPQDWASLLAAIDRACGSDADGVVVTHGSDTLVYSVAAALAFGNLWHKPVCFTGAFFAPDHPESDASLNLLAAMEFVLSPRAPVGVFVAFRSKPDNSQARILSGVGVKPMMFDDSCFDAAYAGSIALFSLDNGLEWIDSPQAPPCLERAQVPEGLQIGRVAARVAYLRLYPGIDRAMLEAAAAGREVLVLEMYHSGTGPADEHSELPGFLQDSATDTTVLMGTIPTGHIELPYDSTLVLKNAGARVYGDLQAHLLYVFAVLGLAGGMGVTEITGKLAGFEV